MTADKKTYDIYSLNYPCYVAGIPEDGVRIVHIPGLFEYSKLESPHGYVLEAYRTKDKMYVFDCMSLNLWYKNKCMISFEKRLKKLRSILNDYICDPKNVIDLPLVLLDNPAEMSDYLDNLLTMGYKKVRIMYAYGEYVFGECKNQELIEMSI